MRDDEARTLAEAAQAGNENARNTLVEAHLGACRHLAVSFAKVAQRTGLDLTQDDLFSEGAEYLLAYVVPKFNTEGRVPFRSWVNLQLRARLSDRVRKCALERRRMAALPSQVGEPAPEPSESETITARDLQRLLDGALESGVLTPDQHRALELSGNGTSPAAIASQMNCTRRLVYYHLQRGTAALQRVNECR